MTVPRSHLKVMRVFLRDRLGSHYGLQISRQSAMAPGSVYPILARLEKLGWISSQWEEIDESREGRPRRRYYKLEALGEREALSRLQKEAENLGIFDVVGSPS